MPQRAHVICDGGDGDRVVTIALQRCRVGASLHQRGDRITMPPECCHVQRRAAVIIAHVHILAAGPQPADLVRIAARGGGEQARVARRIGRSRRDLRQTRTRAGDESLHAK